MFLLGLWRAGGGPWVVQLLAMFSLLCPTLLGMLLFSTKPATSLFQDGCFVSQQHIFIQNEKQEKQKNSSSWVPVIFSGRKNVSLARAGSREQLWTNHCGSRMSDQTGWDQSQCSKHHWSQACFAETQSLCRLNTSPGSVLGTRGASWWGAQRQWRQQAFPRMKASMSKQTSGQERGKWPRILCSRYAGRLGADASGWL